jgi:hypothetical protein
LQFATVEFRVQSAGNALGHLGDFEYFCSFFFVVVVEFGVEFGGNGIREHILWDKRTHSILLQLSLELNLEVMG